MNQFHLFPDQASTGATEIDLIFYVLLGLCLLFSVGIALILAYFAVKYRQTNERVNRAGSSKTNVKLEVAWMVIPLVMALAVFVWGARIYVEVETPPEGALEIYVTAKQWMWKTQHAEGVREINALHVPLGRPIRLTMTSQDVVHSFFVPAFRMKQDVVPGRFTTAWFKATKPGRFRLFCAEYCGTDHSKMGGWITVLEPEEYAEWLASKGGANPILPDIGAVGRQSRGVPNPLAAEGEKVFNRRGCNQCHGANASIQAPPLQGLFGREVKLSDGTTVTADEEYVRESILDPRAKIVSGYQPLMPTYQGQVNSEELVQLVAYLKFLSTALQQPRSAEPPQTESPQ